MMTPTSGVAQLLFDIAEAVTDWIAVLLSTLADVTTAILTNPIAIAVIALAITYAATRFGFGLVKRMIGLFRK